MTLRGIAILKEHEGRRLKPYTDTVGKLTIGYGRNLTDVGISDEEARIHPRQRQGLPRGALRALRGVDSSAERDGSAQGAARVKGRDYRAKYQIGAAGF